jgi:hypothetical protein
MKTFNTSDVCQEAHRLTVLKCKRLGIQVDEEDEDDEDELDYTEEARAIFEEFVNAVEEKWESDEGMVNERELCCYEGCETRLKEPNIETYCKKHKRFDSDIE